MTAAPSPPLVTLPVNVARLVQDVSRQQRVTPTALKLARELADEALRVSHLEDGVAVEAERPHSNESTLWHL